MTVARESAAAKLSRELVAEGLVAEPVEHGMAVLVETEDGERGALVWLPDDRQSRYVWGDRNEHEAHSGWPMTDVVRTIVDTLR